MKYYFQATIAIMVLCIMTVAGCKTADDTNKTDTPAEETDFAASPETEVETADPETLEGRGEQISISLQFNKGDVFGYSIRKVEDLKSEQDTLNADGTFVNYKYTKNKTSIQYDYRFEVMEERDGGGARIQATCKRVKFDGSFENEGGSRNMQYDSDAENDRDKTKTFVQYNAPVNTPFEFIIDGEGNITELLKLDGVVKRLLMDDYASTKLEARNMIQQEYSEMSLRSVVQQAFQEIQDKPLSVDSSWKLAWSGQIGFMQVKNVATYTLQGYEESGQGRIAHITAILKTDYLGKKKFDTGQGMATVEDFNIGGRGASTFNLDTGKPVTRKMKQKLQVRFYIEPPDELKQMAPDQAFNFYLKQDAIIENDVRPLQF